MKSIAFKLLFLLSISLLSCEKSNEEKAKLAIRTYLNENLDDMSTYEVVKFGNLDTVFVFNGQRIIINNHSNSFKIANNKAKGNILGFIDNQENTVIPFDSIHHKLIFANGRMILYENQSNLFYDITTVKTEKLKKLNILNLPKLKHRNNVVKFSKPDTIQFEMLHSFRLKNEKGSKYLTKIYFILNSNFEVVSTNDFSYRSFGKQDLGIDSAATVYPVK